MAGKCKVYPVAMRNVTLSRRTLLTCGSALTLSLLTAPSSAQGGETGISFVLLDGLGTSVEPSIAGKIFEIFFERGLPVCIGIEDFSEDDLRAGSRLPEFLRLVGEVAVREPGLTELAPEFFSTSSDQRYFQLRSANELRRRLAVSPLGDVIGGRIARIATVLDRSGGNPLDPYAFRAAGFRVLIQDGPEPGERNTDATTVTSPDWGLLTISGATSGSVFDRAIDRLGQIPRESTHQLLKLSFAAAENRSGNEILNATEGWANALHTAIWEGQAFITRPLDYLLQGNPGASKLLGLLLDQRGGATAGMTEFARDLEALAFPYSSLMSSSPAPVAGTDLCTAGPGTSPQQTPACAYLEGDPTTLDGLPAEILVLPSSSAPSWSGQRVDARFQISLPEPDGQSFVARHDADPMTDQVELIAPHHVETIFQRRALLRQMQELRQDGRAHFYSVRGFVNQILAPEPALERLWSVRRRFAHEHFREGIPSASDAEELRDDARLAWRYIEKFTNDSTGICAGTAAPVSQNQGVTLWDIGSQVFGILSAWRLTLINRSEATQRCKRLLANLPTVSVSDRRLPPSMFRADTLRRVRSGYDACDTGRFLLALDALVRSGLVDREAARVVINQWELEATVRDGRVYSLSRGRWVDDTLNHCTPYTAPGYAAWGMEIESPYPVLGDPTTGDHQMRLLHRAAFLGHFGAEPFLLAAVERGQSPESRFLSDVLFDAQLSWFERTGRLRCFSEAPLDMSPWFIYQGLRVDRSGDDAWVVSSRSSAARYRTPEFAERAEVISTKAAYLWAASYPHAHSDRLVAFVREKARLEDHGFSSGVYASTSKAMEGYSDLNTNGVILTAIAKLLAQ